MPKRKDPSVQHFHELLRQDPHDVKARFGLAKRLTELQKFNKALEHLQIILLEKPNHKNAQSLKAQVETKLALTETADEPEVNEVIPEEHSHPSEAAAAAEPDDQTDLTGEDGWDMCDTE